MLYMYMGTASKGGYIYTCTCELSIKACTVIVVKLLKSAVLYCAYNCLVVTCMYMCATGKFEHSLQIYQCSPLQAIYTLIFSLLSYIL